MKNRYKRWEEFSNEEMEFLKENYAEKVSEAIHEHIENALIYDYNIKEIVFKYATITELLNGEFGMDDLYENFYQDYYFASFADIAEIVYNEYLTNDEQQEIDNL